MNDDEQFREWFGRVTFAGEPPMSSGSAEDAHRGRHHLRGQRFAAVGGGALGVAALATGVAMLLPGGSAPGEKAAEELPVAGTGSAVESPADEPPMVVPSENTATTTADPHPEPEFPVTRQLLLDTAVEHFDPAHVHLPTESTNGQNGGSEEALTTGTKLGWTNPGEDGEGVVQVALTTPGFAGTAEYAVEGFALDFGCWEPGDCEEQTVPGTGETVLVAGPDSEAGLLFGVVYERPDGSLVGVAVSDLFGNNSDTPVAGVDITLEQLFAFVTDPGLEFDPHEAATGWADLTATHEALMGAFAESSATLEPLQ